ncbi:MAG: SDR family NAD(P)-dependent oxidoreductase [Holophagales bacterium]|nr:SDR family NAD(P)-dependent oxidoreductase [Holophagales bacterium]MYF96607.1 SDR family NAD(P)-dependent oxidoreductase [Holophagales bacterium]
MKKLLKVLHKAVRDRAAERPEIEPLPDSVRIEGRTCLVTGANSGVGKAVAIDLARRGGHVLMACRSGHPEAGEDVRAASGSDRVEMLRVDLSDMRSVHQLCDELRDRGTVLDIAVLNAGLMPRRARRTAQGFETMFAVHFLANRVLVDRWLRDGTVRPADRIEEAPRIVIVSSDAHRSAEPIDFDRFGEFTDYGVRDGLRHYGASKLVLCTYATELSRRLNRDGEGHVVVHSLCPGPVNTAIAREAPWFLKPLVVPMMRFFFLTPEKAARPVSYLCCADDAGKRSGIYLHMLREKRPSEHATDPSNSVRLWRASEALLETHAPLRSERARQKLGALAFPPASGTKRRL